MHKRGMLVNGVAVRNGGICINSENRENIVNLRYKTQQ
jgi:hypothetical protein